MFMVEVIFSKGILRGFVLNCFLFFIVIVYKFKIVFFCVNFLELEVVYFCFFVCCKFDWVLNILYSIGFYFFFLGNILILEDFCIFVFYFCCVYWI